LSADALTVITGLVSPTPTATVFCDSAIVKSGVGGGVLEPEPPPQHVNTTASGTTINRNKPAGQLYIRLSLFVLLVGYRAPCRILRHRLPVTAFNQWPRWTISEHQRHLRHLIVPLPLIVHVLHVALAAPSSVPLASVRVSDPFTIAMVTGSR
jgi:hypothetical protein